MFNPKSDYALNKGDETSIVYQDANGAITRLTVNDFASAAEFQRWKDWMDRSEERRVGKECGG